MNVIMILCDQMRPFELGCYGHPVVQTPNIDRLAQDGVRFELACTTNPLCTPARSSLLSGQYARTCTGMLECWFEPDNERIHFPNATLPEILRDNGYETALIGKWHMQPYPKLVGFDHSVYPKVNHLNVDQDYFDADRNHFIAKGFVPEFELDQLDQYLDKPHDKPFFLYYNISLPHMPYFDVPDRFRFRYGRKDVRLRENTMIDGRICRNDRWFHIYIHDYLYYMDLKEGLTLPNNFDLVDLTAQYYGLISCVDWQIGKILEMLQQKGLEEDTLVIFSSDHGDSLGSHDCYNKHVVYDEAVRIPLIFRLPGKLQKGVRKDTVASLADIAPTILSLTGIPTPDFMHGKDLSGLLRDKDFQMENNDAIFENANGEIAVRTPHRMYSILTSTQDGTPKRKLENDAFRYYDMDNDPYQENNLAKTGGLDGEADALRQRLLEWDETTPWLAGSLGGSCGLGKAQRDWFKK